MPRLKCSICRRRIRKLRWPLIFHLQLMNEIRRGVATMKGYAFVGEKMVSEAEFMAQIIKNK